MQNLTGLMAFARIENADVADRRVLVRADFESAVDNSGRLVSEAPLKSVRATLEMLLARGAAPVLLAHAGRVEDPTSAKVSFGGLVEPLSKLLATPVQLAALDDARAAPQSITLVENLLQYSGEAKNESSFGARLAALGDLYVNDAFGACRRELASLLRLPRLLPAFAGVAFHQEWSCLSSLLSRDRRPLVVVIGGMRLEKKIRLLTRIMEKIDSVHVVGGLAATFLKSRALPVGSSFVERELEVPAFQLIEKSELAETELFLPADLIVAERFARDAKTRVVAANQIPERWTALDIGPKTVSRIEKAIKGAGAVLWMGPAGAIEFEAFQKGSRAIAQAMAKAKALRVAAGASTAASLSAWGFEGSLDLVSLDSEAVSEFLIGGSLPGLAALSASGN